ncbi:MAG: hypothetical protein HC828_17840, partial [Blastochloris sp.]|nr:hypothetical protein [Blastochloris sp.]
LYVVSAVYHIGTWSERRRIILRTLDHANIFIFIAGAYTPICIIDIRFRVAPFRRIVIMPHQAGAHGGCGARRSTRHSPRSLDARDRSGDA